MINFEVVKELKRPLNKRFDSPYAFGFPYDFGTLSGINPSLKNNLNVLIKGSHIQNLVLSDSVIEYKFISSVFSINDTQNPLFFIESTKGQLSFDLLMLKKDSYLYVIASSYMPKAGSVDSFTLSKMIEQ